MRFMGIFVGMIILLISQALPDWIVALFVLVLLVVLRVDDLAKVISPLGQPTVWLVFGVLAMAAGIGNSGVIKRIAYKMLTLFPTTYRGTVLSMITTSVVLSPMISSVLAKASLLTDSDQSNRKFWVKRTEPWGFGYIYCCLYSGLLFRTLFHQRFGQRRHYDGVYAG